MIQLVYKISQFLLIAFFLLLSHLGFSQLKIPEKPSFIPPIIDSTQTLSEIQKKQLYDKLKNYSDSTSTELFVMIVSTTQGELISRYATDLGHKWEIGQKGKDNGIVFLIAKDDRKMTIQAGYGTEHLLTDALSRRIIEVVVKPEFKDGKYFEGIDEGTTAIIKVMNGEYKNDKKKSGKGFSPVLIFVIIFIIINNISKCYSCIFIFFYNFKFYSSVFSAINVVIIASNRNGTSIPFKIHFILNTFFSCLIP